MELNIYTGVTTVDFKGAMIITNEREIVKHGNTKLIALKDYKFISMKNMAFVDKFVMTFKVFKYIWF